MGEEMPVLFIGHGSPENALEDNAFTRNWRTAADLLPRPQAILCVSAHWLKEGTAVTGMPHPKTIHDFYGFPDELYKVRYAAPGAPALAKRVASSIATVKTGIDLEWGLDHGTWSVLLHMYPKADVPVLQLSLDYFLPLEKQYEIGRDLKALRDEGVLIIGSGNLVHNLMQINPSGKPYEWAVEFDRFVKTNLERRNDKELINYATHRSASLAHPTYDHYLPLMYVLGVTEGEKPQFFNEAVFAGSVSMRCAVFGAENGKL